MEEFKKNNFYLTILAIFYIIKSIKKFNIDYVDY